jgi:hypothetical protein
MALDYHPGGGGARPLGMVIRIFYGEPHPYRASLSDVRVIMMFICVLVVESPCQAAMGWTPAPECLLAGVYGYVWSCLALNSLAI